MSSGNWNNKDGLYLEFGTSKSAVDVAGEYKTYGDLREVNIRLDLSTLTSTPAVISQNLRFPTGCRIVQVTVYSDTAVTGTSGTLDLGFVKEDRTTELDYNGLIAAMTQATMANVGTATTLTAGVSTGGALLGVSNTSVGILTANYNTTALVGTLDIRVFYYGRGTITQ